LTISPAQPNNAMLAMNHAAEAAAITLQSRLQAFALAGATTECAFGVFAMTPARHKRLAPAPLHFPIAAEAQRELTGRYLLRFVHSLMQIHDKCAVVVARG
jgi:hypothetical protein